MRGVIGCRFPSGEVNFDNPLPDQTHYSLPNVYKLRTHATTLVQKPWLYTARALHPARIYTYVYIAHAHIYIRVYPRRASLSLPVTICIYFCAGTWAKYDVILAYFNNKLDAAFWWRNDEGAEDIASVACVRVII